MLNSIHRVAEPAGRLVERPAGHRDVARDSPHGQDNRSHGRAIEQRKGARITRQGQRSVEVRSWRHGMSSVERVRVAAYGVDDERHRIRIRQSLPVEACRNWARACGGQNAPMARIIATTNHNQVIGFIGPLSFFMRSPSSLIFSSATLKAWDQPSCLWRHELSLVDQRRVARIVRTPLRKLVVQCLVQERLGNTTLFART